MVRLARTGERVLRLKAVTHSYSAAVVKQSAFQVVPGITAASGCVTYTGIPLTHRNYTQSCVFVTGHVRDGSMDLNWDALVQRQQTIVIYMALKGLTLLCQQLIKHGMSSDTPAALIEQGTTPRQRVFVGTLEILPETISAADVHAPTLVIVGNVVRLQQKLAWFQPGQ